MSRLFLLTLIIIIILPTLLLAQAQRYYMDQLAAGQNTGQSWTDAFRNLHDALALAAAGDEIWVAKGNYFPSVTGDRSARFQLLSGVQLYGGFAGVEMDLSERVLAATTTVVDGDLGMADDSSDNSYNLLYLYRPDSLTVVDGFTFRSALANNTTAAGELGSSGAALYIMAFDGEAYPTIRHCRFEHNMVLWNGGAVYVEGGGEGSVAPVFEDCYFGRNRALQGSGGAIYRNGGSWMDRPEDINNCVFEKNSARLQGGAIFFADSPRTDTFDICYTIWINNKIDSTIQTLPGMLQSSGLQITNLRTSGASSLSITNLEASGHNTGNGFILWGEFTNFEFSNLISSIDSMRLDSNYGIGGSILGSALASIKNITLINTYGIGLGAYSVSSYSLFKNINIIKPSLNLRFQANAEVVDFENIVCLDNTSYFELQNENGLSLNASNIIENSDKFILKVSNFNSPGKIKILNSTILKNLSNSSIVCPQQQQQTEIRNCILLDANPFFLPGFATVPPIYDHNLFNFPDTFANTNYWIKTNNLWNTDPQFMQPDSGNFRLQPCSPARDAGNNAAVISATDVAGNARILGAAVDIGAYESPAFGLAAAPVIKPACTNMANGMITPALIGACPPVLIAWQSGSQTGATLDSLSAGTYSVTLTDSQGRNFAFYPIVPAANPPGLQVDGAPVSCFGANDGLASVTPLSGQPPFSYAWSPPVTNDSVAVDLPPGPISVFVTDAWGCAAGFDYHILEPDPLLFTAIVQDASGQQSADGSILIDAITGGTSPYAYLWAPIGSMTDNLQNLLPGQYLLTITDDHGCVALGSFQVGYVSATSDMPEETTLSIYPNPTTGLTTLQGDFSGRTPALLALYDDAGRLVRTWSWLDKGAGSFSLAGLAKGVYIVRLQDTQGQLIGSGRLVKE